MKKKWIVIIVVALLVMIGSLYVIAISTNDTIYYSKMSYNRETRHGYLMKKGLFGRHKVDNVMFDSMTLVDNNTILGYFHDSTEHICYVSAYDLKKHKYNVLTKIHSSTSYQRISANKDMSAIYYMDLDDGVVRYDVATGETTVAMAGSKIYYPMVTSDEKLLYYVGDYYLKLRDLESGEDKTLAENVDSFALSHNEDFIIFTRLKGIYKLDLETGQETEMQAYHGYGRPGEISISSDDKRFAYVTYNTSLVPGIDNTLLHVCNIRTGKSRVVYRSHYIEQVTSIMIR